MYRAITYLALQRGIDPDDGVALAALADEARLAVEESAPGRLERVTVDGIDATPHLRSAPVEAAVSQVSRVPAVREALVRQQRALAREGRIVVAGRDIGTVVLPDADLKVYLDASFGERVRRRQRELATTGRDADDQAAVAQQIRHRDQIDSSRAASPMRPAADAIVINTDSLSLEDVVERILGLVRSCESSAS